MECKRDSFSGAFGGAKETYWERVSHALKPVKSEIETTYQVFLYKEAKID